MDSKWMYGHFGLWGCVLTLNLPMRHKGLWSARSFLCGFLVIFLIFCHLLSPPLPSVSSNNSTPYPMNVFFSLTVAGVEDAVTPGFSDIKSTRLALLLYLSPPFSFLHSSVWLPLTPTWAWQAFWLHVSPIGECFSVVAGGDQGPAEWWMAIPLALSFPSPDRSPLIAFPGLGFAGNGLKHDMSLTRCLPRERKGVP